MGEGRHFNWVQKQVAKRKLGSTVHLLGHYPVDTMPEFFAAADMMLVTLKDEPVFALTVPCKIQSYLACAKPIIAALPGEGGHLVEQAGAGMKVQASNPTALANAINQCHRLDEHQLQQMSEAGYQYYMAHFQRDKLLEKLEGWIGNTMAEDQVFNKTG